MNTIRLTSFAASRQSTVIVVVACRHDVIDTVTLPHKTRWAFLAPARIRSLFGILGRELISWLTALVRNNADQVVRVFVTKWVFEPVSRFKLCNKELNFVMISTRSWLHRIAFSCNWDSVSIQLGCGCCQWQTAGWRFRMVWPRLIFPVSLIFF